MRGNRGSDTRPELRIRQLLCESGYSGYRLQWPIAGRPDVAYPGRRLAIFVHGCFWHGCELCAIRPPSHNAHYWAKKIERNRARDVRVNGELRQAGWQVFVIRECDLRNGVECLAPVLEQLACTTRATETRTPGKGGNGG
ncbi:very short patch repair endonuclease [bacterium]|nr:MAG: very short patch repair endonuclease [bacterium]